MRRVLSFVCAMDNQKIVRIFAVGIMSWKETPDIAAALEWTLLCV